jgi:hypothetical protein
VEKHTFFEACSSSADFDLYTKLSLSKTR